MCLFSECFPTCSALTGLVRLFEVSSTGFIDPSCTTTASTVFAVGGYKVYQPVVGISNTYQVQFQVLESRLLIGNPVGHNISEYYMHLCPNQSAVFVPEKFIDILFVNCPALNSMDQRDCPVRYDIVQVTPKTVCTVCVWCAAVMRAWCCRVFVLTCCVCGSLP